MDIDTPEPIEEEDNQPMDVNNAITTVQNKNHSTNMHVDGESKKSYKTTSNPPIPVRSSEEIPKKRLLSKDATESEIEAGSKDELPVHTSPVCDLFAKNGDYRNLKEARQEQSSCSVQAATTSYRKTPSTSSVRLTQILKLGVKKTLLKRWEKNNKENKSQVKTSKSTNTSNFAAKPGFSSKRTQQCDFLHNSRNEDRADQMGYYLKTLSHVENAGAVEIQKFETGARDTSSLRQVEKRFITETMDNSQPQSEIFSEYNISSKASTVTAKRTAKHQCTGAIANVSGLKHCAKNSRNLFLRQIALEETVKRTDEMTKIVNEETFGVESGRSALDAILEFRGHSSPLSTLALCDSRLYCEMKDSRLFPKAFTLAVVPGHDSFKNVLLINYISKHAKVHLVMLENTNGIDTLAKYDDLCADYSEKMWDSACKMRMLWKDTETDRFPFITKTIDFMFFFLRIISKFFISDERVAEFFFKEFYVSGKTSLAHRMLKVAMLLIDIWSKLKKSSAKSYLFERAVQVLSKLIQLELLQPSFFPKLLEENRMSIDLFEENKQFSFLKIFQLCFDYYSAESDKRETLPFVKMYHACVTALMSPQKPAGLSEQTWAHIKNVNTCTDFLTIDSFWSLVVKGPLQSMLSSQKKAYSAFSEIAFSISLLRHTLTCQQIFSTHKKTKEIIFDIVLRTLKEIARNPLPIFTDMLEYECQFVEGLTCIDLIKQVLSGYGLKEFISSSSSRRESLFSSLRELISSSMRVTWEQISRECVEVWWRHGLYGKSMNSLMSSDDHIGIVKSKRELQARQYAISCIGSVLGSLCVSYYDGSHDITKQNIINSILCKMTSARPALRILEEVLTIQVHLEKFVVFDEGTIDEGSSALGGEENKMNSEAGFNSQKQKGKMRRNFSDKDHQDFCRVLEAIRIRVCELKKHPIKISETCEPHRKSGKIGTNAPSGTTQCFLQGTNDHNELHSIASTEKGFSSLNDDVPSLKSVTQFSKDSEEKTLACLEANGEVLTTWIQLRRNIYVNDARELLKPEEREEGQMCSCLSVDIDDQSSVSLVGLGCVNDTCENRMVKTECGPGPCGAGELCRNRRLQNMEYAKTKTAIVKDKGFGLFAVEQIKGGSLIGEYQGEVIPMTEYKRRCEDYDGERHFYFMTLTNKLVIDARRKSQITRFVNHSCDPNCVAEKWNAGGEPRIAIVATRTIHPNEEVTFDYGAQAIGNDLVSCLCGASSCRGKLTSFKPTNQSAQGDNDSMDLESFSVEMAEDSEKEY